MTPTEINILIAVLATVFGIAIRHVWGYYYIDSAAMDIIDDWQHVYEQDVAESFTMGFKHGVAVVDNEDAEGDSEIGELLEKGYLTWDELEQLSELDILADIPDDVLVRG